ncbi:MAG: hypothetical protein AB1646_22190 [Thermodesulfobacteriota bacterium]
MKAIRCILLGALVVMLAASVADAQWYGGGCGAGWGSGWGYTTAPAWNTGWGWGGNWGWNRDWGWTGGNRGWGWGNGAWAGGWGWGCGAPVVCKPAKKAKKAGGEKKDKK